MQKFEKWQGCGNDFIIIDRVGNEIESPEKICHTGFCNLDNKKPSTIAEGDFYRRVRPGAAF